MIRALILLLALVPFCAAAQQMYKWVDEKGTTHFSEYPPPEGKDKATKVEVKPPATEAARGRWKGRELESRQRRCRDAGEEGAGRRRRARRCSDARQSLDTMKNSRRVYNLDDKGERVYVEDKDRPAAIEKWNREVERNCR